MKANLGLLFSQLLPFGICARILVVLPFPGKSHHMFATAIMNALLERGHSIIEYSPFHPKHLADNHTHYKIRTSFEKDSDKLTFDDFKQSAASEKSIFGAKVVNMWYKTYPICEDTFKNKNIQNLLQFNEKIDLVITEAMFGQESLLVFGHIFYAPTVVLESFVPSGMVNWAAGNGLSISSVPDMHAVEMENEAMSFVERALNLISMVKTLYLYNNVHLPTQDLIMRRSLPSDIREVPPLEQLLANVSLYFINTHPAAVNYPQPSAPNMVAVGGINIGQGGELLSQELRTFMDDAHDGVIYFSMGSYVPSHTIPIDTLLIFTRVFQKLRQKVLWKIDLAKLVDKRVAMPPNIKAIQWAPQVEVLGHRNCRLFITHGGLNSHQEAMLAGVPTVGIPLIADQPYNVRYSEHRGTGRYLPLPTLSQASLYDAITAVLNDPKYRENAKRMSRIYNDRLQSPKDDVIYWVEYVLRHRGAPHLRPASASMVWYQRVLIDVIALTVITFLIVAITTYKAFSFLCRKFFKTRNTTNGKRKLN